MAGLATDCRVRAQQRKPVLVVVHRLQRHTPAKNVVALLAIRVQLAAVNVGMAIGTLPAGVGKHQTDMALPAFHYLM